MRNPLVDVQQFGQSIWYDNIRRGLILSGDLRAMVERDGLMGVTSNPAIFEKAIAGSTDYDGAMKELARKNANEAYESLAIEDIRLAADVLRPVYERTQGADGYVSLEVSPYLAHDTQATIQEARRLRDAVARENVMIKVPATREGIPAIEQLIADGLDINVTLLFAVEAYADVAEAYLRGLEKRGQGFEGIASVASFFVSRIDTLVDDELGRKLDQSRDEAERAKLKSLVGKVAIANAKIAYAKFQEITASPRWKALAAKGARPQRLLWASTSTKNPKYPKTIYIDELIGPQTVNTVPAETFAEYRTNGNPRASLTAGLEEARATMQLLDEVGVSMKTVTDALLVDGVKKFSEAFDKLLSAVEDKRQGILGTARPTYPQTPAVQAALADWRANGKVRRLWAKDASLWSGKDEADWMGWLHVVEAERESSFQRLVEDARRHRHVVVIGMGGSSLCPYVLRQTFGLVPGFPELHVLDSIVPAQVRAIDQAIDPDRTLFVVSSKSGGTIEPNVIQQHFFERAGRDGSKFIAVTDPGTKLHQAAKDARFRHILHGIPSIGGRYSALSNFGIVPAALLGIDVEKFLGRAEIMAQACASCVPPESNPGVFLGVVLGAFAKSGRDKVTIVASPSIGTIGSWIEQLIAESTGKEGRGIVPVDEERLGPPEVYGNDRLFVHLRHTGEHDAAIAALEKAGHPVVRIPTSPEDLGQEFFRWEIATAVAGSILGINPFNQPDVEAAKVAARSLMAEYEKSGRLNESTPAPMEKLGPHLASIRPGDYFAVNAYLEMNGPNHALLQEIRHLVRDRKRVATTLGYGPRFLHSTGQLHKGGPNTGVFLQITSDDAADLPIPGQKFSFGVLKRAQAQGDYEVLVERGRRIVRVHLGADVPSGLAKLRDAVRTSL